MKMLGVAASIGAVLLLLVACSGGGSGERFRYRMTVEVDTPAGIRSGASVHEIRSSYQNHFGLAPCSRTLDTIGEAVAVDLPGGQTLFALAPSAERVQRALDPEWQNDWVESTRRIAARGNSNPLNLPVETNRERTPSGLPRQYEGLFVRFRHLDRPDSVEEVNPGHLEQAFGPGYALRRVTVQLTDEPVTSGIERRLPWLPKYYDLKFSGDRYSSAENPSQGIFASMTSGAFSVGMGLSPNERGSNTKRGQE